MFNINKRIMSMLLATAFIGGSTCVSIADSQSDSIGFSANFTSINGNNCNYYGSSSAYNLALGKQDIFTYSDGAKWVTSEVYKGYNADNPGFCYIDQSKSLAIKGKWNDYFSNVNLDLSDEVEFEKINSVSFKTKNTKATISGSSDPSLGSSRSTGLNLFVSGDEKTYYQFGQRTDQLFNGFYDKSDPGSDESMAANKSTAWVPYVKKYVNGVATIIDNDVTVSGWNDTDLAISWEITIDGDNISWSATGAGTNTTWTGAHTDTDGIINAMWKYPLSAFSCGNGYGYLTEMSFNYEKKAPWEYEKKKYTMEELSTLYENAMYSGRDCQVEKVMALDLGDVIHNTGKINVNVNEDTVVRSIDNDMLGIQCEFMDYYDVFFDQAGELREDYKEFAKNSVPSPVYRFGGNATNSVNFMHSIGEYDERTPSYYVSLPEKTSYTLGAKAGDAYKMGIVEYIKMAYANNPDAEFIPCISFYTTTPADSANLVHFLTDDSQTEWGQKRASMGLTEPVKIKYIELSNEIDVDKGAGRLTDDAQGLAWYVENANQHMAAMSEANANVKFMVCGPTAPWGTTAAEARISVWVTYLMKNITHSIDAVSFHPYYYGHSPEYMITLSQTIKDTIYNAIGENDIKICHTEHAKNWNNTSQRYRTQDLLSSLQTAYFLGLNTNKDFVDTISYHGLLSTGNLWAYWKYANGEFHYSPTEKAYDVINNALGDKIYSLSTTAVDKTSFRLENRDLDMEFNAVATANNNSNNLTLILTNWEAYTDIDLDFSFLGNYKLMEETVFTAPNAGTFMYNNNCDKLFTTTTTEKNVENFSEYKMPTKSLVVLKLKNRNSTPFSYETQGSNINISVSPEAYEVPEVSVITAFFNENLELTNVDFRKVSENTNYSVKVPENYYKRCIFVWNDMTPLDKSGNVFYNIPYREQVFSDAFDVPTPKLGRYSTTDKTGIVTSAGKTTAFNDNWQITIPKNVVGETIVNDDSTYYEVSDNGLKIGHAGDHATKLGRIGLTDKNRQLLSRDLEIAFDFARRSYDTTNGETIHDEGNVSTIFTRFMADDATDSYYEIGLTGDGESLNRYHISMGDESDTTGYATNTKYQFRFYFRKVVNNVEEYVVWDNEDEGLFKKSYLFSANTTDINARYPRIRATSYFSIRNGETDSKRVTANVTVKDGQVSWSLEGMFSTLFDNKGEYVFCGTYNDSTPLAKDNLDLQFGVASRQRGMAIENVVITNLSSVEGEN